MARTLLTGVIIKGIRISVEYSEKFKCWAIESEGDGVYECHGAIKSRQEMTRIYREKKEFYKNW